MGLFQFNASYSHDKLDRLLTQNILSNTNTLSYVYDNNHNRTKKTTNTSTGIVEDITAVNTDNNQYTAYTYDASGSVLNDGKRNYSYDSKGRINSIQLIGEGNGFYTYNALEQRIQKTINNQRTYFVYDQQGQLLGEYDQDNNPIREYIYLGNIPIAMFTAEKEGDVLQIHTDHLGTPRAVTDKAQEVLWRMDGDQFGDVQPQVETITLPLRHAGQYYDGETGLFYNYFRYYDPKSGRYLRSDPLGLFDGTNPYSYVHGNPLLEVDPTGENAARIGFGAATMALKYICRKNPKLCKEAMECIRNPRSCKNKFCKSKPNRLYHGDDRKGVCDVPGCKSSDSVATKEIKKNAALACMVLRKFVAFACHNGKMDPEHTRQYRDARNKYRKCQNC